MLVTDYDPKLLVFPCYVQPKLNGIRAVWNGKSLRSRDGKKFSPNVLPHIYKALASLGDEVLDGELYVHGWSLQRINSACAVKRVKPNHDSPKIEYHVFDVLKNYDFVCRHDYLKELSYVSFDPLCYYPGHSIDNMDQLQILYALWINEGYEGVILRTPQSLYHQNFRSPEVMRIKPWYTSYHKVVGCTPGKDNGKYSHTLGALTLCTKEGKLFSASSGLSDKERDRMWKGDLPNGAIVAYEDLSGDGIPLKPRIVNYYNDFPADSAELLSMEPERHHHLPIK